MTVRLGSHLPGLQTSLAVVSLLPSSLLKPLNPALAVTPCTACPRLTGAKDCCVGCRAQLENAAHEGPEERGPEVSARLKVDTAAFTAWGQVGAEVLAKAIALSMAAVTSHQQELGQRACQAPHLNPNTLTPKP